MELIPRPFFGLNDNGARCELKDILCLETIRGYDAVFKDKDGITIKTVNLEIIGKNYPKKIILSIPNNIWLNWSEIFKVEINECGLCLPEF